MRTQVVPCDGKATNRQERRLPRKLELPVSHERLLQDILYVEKFADATVGLVPLRLKATGKRTE